MPAKLIDLTNQEFGYWRVLERDLSCSGKEACWICKCQKCNQTIKSIRGSRLRRGESKSCGCNPSFTDLAGKKFNSLTVLQRMENYIQPNGKSIIKWKCQCDCGNITYLTTDALTGSRPTKSCGCLQKLITSQTHLDDLTGQYFGKLLVVSRKGSDSIGSSTWLCQCECGKQTIVASHSLKSGRTKSCGCINYSIGENNIKEILDENNIKYEKEKTFSDLISQRKLRYDFYLPEYNRLIEFDGEQHYKEIQGIWKNDNTLEERQYKDRIKNEYALKNNFNLIRIPYWERDNIDLDMLLGEKYLVVI